MNSLLERITPPEKPQEPTLEDEMSAEVAIPPVDGLGFLDAPLHTDVPEHEEPPSVSPSDVVAARVAAEPDESDEPVEDDSSIHNPGAALPLSRIRDRLRAIRQSAVESGILSRVSEPVSPPPAEDSAQAEPVADVEQNTLPPGLKATGTQRERLASFAVWARGQLQEHGGHIVVMDDAGELLWGGEGNPAMVLSTMMACGAAIRASAGPACGVGTVIRRVLASGNVLTVIPTPMDAGGLHVAVTAPVALSDEVAERLRAGLAAVMRDVSRSS
ncbi:MAG: hypothetical protein R3F13_11740 [Prosthecobacter sp.]